MTSHKFPEARSQESVTEGAPHCWRAQRRMSFSGSQPSDTLVTPYIQTRLRSPNITVSSWNKWEATVLRVSCEVTATLRLKCRCAESCRGGETSRNTPGVWGCGCECGSRPPGHLPHSVHRSKWKCGWQFTTHCLWTDLTSLRLIEILMFLRK